MPARASKRKRGKKHAEEETEAPVATSNGGTNSKDDEQQDTSGPSQDAAESSADGHVKGESEEDIKRVLDFIASIQAQHRQEQEQKTDEEGEGADAGTSLQPGSPSQSPDNMPSNVAGPSSGSTTTTARTKPKSRGRSKKQTTQIAAQQATIQQLMANIQGQFQLSNGVSVPWVTFAQNAVQCLQAGQVPSRDSREGSANHDDTEVPAKRMRSSDSHGESDMSGAPSERGWTNIHFQGKKLLVPADSLSAWKAYDPATVILGPDPS